MWPFDDEEEKPGMTPVQPMSVAQPEMQMQMGTPAAQPMNPQVKDYLTQKYGLDQFSPEKRAAIEKQNEEDASGPNWLAGLAAFGAGLQGGNAAQAGANFLNMQNQQRQGKLDAFDKNRQLAMQDLNDKDMLARRERENDPNSEESKVAQRLAAKMGGGGLFTPEQLAGLTAAKFKELSPAFSKMYQIDEGIKVRDDQQALAREKLKSEQDLKKAMLAMQAEKNQTKAFTPGQQALDKSFAKEYDDWTSGGEAAVDKNLQRLKEAQAKLAKVKDDTFGTSGPLTGRLPNFLRSEESKTIEQDVRAAAQGALRATLGAQFTEKEGERIMNAAYDPTLSPEANMKKIDLAIQELESSKLAKNAKAAHFEQNGTLQGLAKQDLPRSDAGQRKVVKKLRSPSTGKTKLVYNDGTEEIVNEAVANAK